MRSALSLETRFVRAAPRPGTLIGVLAIALLFGSACNQKVQPVTAPSGEQAGYAERYPSRLNEVRTRFADDENKVRSNAGEFKGYPDALRSPTSYEHARNMVEKADATGKSSAYTEASLEAETVSRFFSEEKDGLRQKVGGAVNYAAGQKQCTEDLGGVAIGAMERGVDKQMEERLRSRSEAHRYIEDHQEELGKQNFETLNKQADKIAQASNLAYVRLELHRREVETLLSDSSTVRSTLDRTISESDAGLAQPNLSRNKKALLERRRNQAQTARGNLDSEVEQGKKAVEEMQQRITAIQNEYKTALDALNQDLQTRAQKK